MLDVKRGFSSGPHFCSNMPHFFCISLSMRRRDSFLCFALLCFALGSFDLSYCGMDILLLSLCIKVQTCLHTNTPDHISSSPHCFVCLLFFSRLNLFARVIRRHLVSTPRDGLRTTPDAPCVFGYFLSGEPRGSPVGRQNKPGARKDERRKQRGRGDGRNQGRTSLRIGSGGRKGRAQMNQRRGSLKRRDRTAEKEAREEAALERKRVQLPE